METAAVNYSTAAVSFVIPAASASGLLYAHLIKREDKMPKTISATQAKNQFGALVEAVKGGEGAVIVVNRGEPAVAIIPVSRYEDLERFEKEERHREAAATLRRLRAEIQAQNTDLTEESAAELIERIEDDLMNAIAAKLELRHRE